jgi:uncharacterized membrane protein
MAGNRADMTRDGSSGADRSAGGAERPPGASATTRVSLSILAGACASALASLLGSWQVGTLVGWDVAAAAYVAWTWMTIWRRDPAATAHLALREDPRRASADALLLVASVASVLAVGLVITAGRTAGPGTRDAHAALAVASVALSWTVVQTVFTSHYARLYYSHPAGGIDFNQQAPPRFSDFAYLAFTAGMTFQISDTNLETPTLRATVLRHALLSYLLGAVILATTINLVSSLLR